jgi:thymidylate synthase (FAD)
MKTILPSFEILDVITKEDGIKLLRRIELLARISHRTEDKQTDTSWERFLTAVVMQHGDWSVTEHVGVTVIFRVDRGVTHELVRHRIGAYTQESTRFVNYGNKDIEFVKPFFAGAGASESQQAHALWCSAMRDAELTYRELLDVGQPPQMARSVLPNATASTIATTYNLRQWRHFFLMRTPREVHPDFLRVTLPLLATFQERIPLLYADIEPNIKQSISIARAR